MNPATQMPRILRHNAGQWETLEKDIFIEAPASITINRPEGLQHICGVSGNLKPKNTEKIIPKTNLTVCFIEKSGGTLIGYTCFDQYTVYIHPERIINTNRVLKNLLKRRHNL